MQFVSNGPDIPDELLQAQEEGRLIFFCGAGISYPAGLPGFKGLVDQIYENVGTRPNELEKKAYDQGSYDTTLDLLERRLPGQRIAVRKALKESLKPNLRLKGAKDNHEALLQLSRSRDGALRLVTTNFDDIFDRVARGKKGARNIYSAPMLPVPKNSRWDGLVYLHGKIPKDDDESKLNSLVVTSGDFGLAYLNERWAARFVNDLFKNYLICFVGYSIDDPVLRYMMDALAADSMLGEEKPQAYALGPCAPGKEHSAIVEWEAKGVTPILYEVPPETQDHSALPRTLKVWSETYRDGILGKERIVLENAMAKPSASTKQDDFVGRLMWALADRSGFPAKQFAEFEPAPPLEWLEPFSKDRYGHRDLVRFGVSPFAEEDENLIFSLVRRPAPYTNAPRMALASNGAIETWWDKVMGHLAHWLGRHLDNPDLILWLAQQGGQLHEDFKNLIEDKLNNIYKLEQEEDWAELARINAHSPHAIPRKVLRPLWHLFLTDRVKTFGTALEWHRWKEQFKRNGLTTTMRFRLREILAPKVRLKKPFGWFEDGQGEDEDERLKQMVDWELVLNSDHVYSTLGEMEGMPNWKEVAPLLVGDFQQLLVDALDLLNELGEADCYDDRSFWDQPSISPHWQNRGFRDWVALIELLRDAWLSIHQTDNHRSARVARDWFTTPYPTFKRLALFAASQDDCIPPNEWVAWLLKDNSWWLWSPNTHREVLRLFVLQGPNLSEDERDHLEGAILTGPPRTMYREDLEPERWQQLFDGSVWLHLAKLEASGLQLGEMASKKLSDLSETYPNWYLRPNERDEFLHWMSGTGDPDFEAEREVEQAPRKRGELVEWLKQAPSPNRPFYEDTWPNICRTRFFHSAFALRDLGCEGSWPSGRWRDALHAWSEDGLILRSWRFSAPLVAKMPDEVLGEIAQSLTRWLESVSKYLDCYEEYFLNICQRILNLSYKDGIEEKGQPVLQAINHPIGNVVHALINFWLRGEPNDNEGLPADIKPLFSLVCDTGVEQYRHGRVLIASHLIAFYRVDRYWAENKIIPVFNWEISAIEAQAVWEGFLWSPRLYRPILLALKPSFLDTANHYNNLEEHGRQYPALLTYAALEKVESFTSQEFQEALGSLPQEGLNEAAQSLVQALEAAGDKKEEFWANRIRPFWHEVWPKSRELGSKEISESIARLIIGTGQNFPEALSTVGSWLRPIEHPDFVIHLLAETQLSEKFPGEVLTLLDSIIGNRALLAGKLGQCLSTISNVDPSLKGDSRYQRLIQYLR